MKSNDQHQHPRCHHQSIPVSQYPRAAENCANTFTCSNDSPRVQLTLPDSNFVSECRAPSMSCSSRPRFLFSVLHAFTDQNKRTSTRNWILNHVNKLQNEGRYISLTCYFRIALYVSRRCMWVHGDVVAVTSLYFNQFYSDQNKNYILCLLF